MCTTFQDIENKKMMTIDPNTGNCVNHYIASNETEIVYNAEDILCYGCWDYKGVNVILKEQVPHWENLSNPKLVYANRLEDIFVITPSTGESVIIWNGDMVDSTDPRLRVIHVFEEDIGIFGNDNVALLICECNIFGFCKYQKRVFCEISHSIPDIENSVFLDANTEDGIVLYQNHYITGYFPVVGLNYELLDVMVSEIGLDGETIGTLDLFEYRGRTICVDQRTMDCASFMTRKQMHLLQGLTPDIKNMVVTTAIIKFYMDDGRILALSHEDFYELEEDNFLPYPKRFSAKSANNM